MSRRIYVARATDALLDSEVSQQLNLPRLGAEKLSDFMQRTARRLTSWGVTVPATSRVHQCAALLADGQARMDRNERLSPEEKMRIGQAGRDAFELYLASHATDAAPSEMELSKWQEAVQGARTESEEKTHHARDIQCELYVLGMFRAGGMSAQLDEPDLVAQLGDHRLGVAVKRIWSLKQARKRLSKAVEQIRRSGHRGIIALNAQEYVGAEAHRSDRSGTPEIEESLKRLYGYFPQTMSPDSAIGTLFTGISFHWRDEPSGTITFSNRAFFQFVYFSSDDAEHRMLTDAWLVFLRSLQGWVDEHM